MVRNSFELKIYFILALQLFNFSQGRAYELTHKLNSEKTLISDLIKNYQVKYGRPVNNMTEKVVVYFEVCLIQLIDLDERNQVLVTNVQTQYVWRDNGLKWNPKDYGGLEYIHLPVAKIWTPDIVLYNYADTRLEEKREVLVIVNADGKVRWRPPSIFKSTCQINIELFPYDHQNCSMKFGSWSYDESSIDIQFLGNAEMNTDLYLVSNEWEILTTKGKRNTVKYECCKEVYPDVTYYMEMKRKGGFYNYILVFPCFLLTCLTTVLFWLPPESPAKMVLGMNIFTSFFVLLLLLSKNVPSATDKIPLIGAYYCLNMVMIATSTCSCTVVVHIFFRGQGQVPTLLRKIFLEILAHIFCMIAPPVLPATAAKAKIQSQQPATIITSLNNQTNQSNGNLQHHVNRSSIALNSSQRLSQQQSTSMTALNADPNQQALAQQMSYDGVPQLLPSNLHYQNNINSQGFQTLPSAHRNTSLASQTSQNQNQSQLQIAHVHGHQQSKHLNSELNLSFNLIENDIKEIRDYLRHTRKKLETTDSKTKQNNEWKQVALVLDRALFFLYIIANIVAGFFMLKGT